MVTAKVEETVAEVKETVNKATAKAKEASEEVKEAGNKAAAKVKETVEDAQKKLNEMVEDTAFDAFIEHQKNALQAAGKAFQALIPEGVKKHGETAVKESLEGYRQLFNSALDEVVTLVQKAKIEDGAPKKKTTKK